MTEQEAVEITSLIKAATSSRPDQTTLNYFQAALLGLDFDIALSAARLGTITWEFFPSWAKFKEIYRAEKRLSEPVGEQRNDTTEQPEYPKSPEPGVLQHPGDVPKRGDHAPEWVHVWRWARLARDPRNLRGFPQQEGWLDPSHIMPLEEYEKLREEWLAAGSPKNSNPIPMAR